MQLGFSYKINCIWFLKYFEVSTNDIRAWCKTTSIFASVISDLTEILHVNRVCLNVKICCLKRQDGMCPLHLYKNTIHCNSSSSGLQYNPKRSTFDLRGEFFGIYVAQCNHFLYIFNSRICSFKGFFLLRSHNYVSPKAALLLQYEASCHAYGIKKYIHHKNVSDSFTYAREDSFVLINLAEYHSKQ